MKEHCVIAYALTKRKNTEPADGIAWAVTQHAHTSDSSISLRYPSVHPRSVMWPWHTQPPEDRKTTRFSFSVSLSAVMSETPCQIFRGVCSSPRCWFSARMGTWGERRVGCSPTASPRCRRRTMPAIHRRPRSGDRGMRRCLHQVTVTASAGFIFGIIYILSISSAMSSACGVLANNRDVFVMGYMTTKDMGALLTAVLAVS